MKFRWLLLIGLILVCAIGAYGWFTKPTDRFFMIKQKEEGLVGKFFYLSPGSRTRYAITLANRRMSSYQPVPGEELTNAEQKQIQLIQDALKNSISRYRLVRIQARSAHSNIKPEELEGLITKISEQLNKQADNLSSLIKSITGESQEKILSDQLKAVTEWQEFIANQQTDFSDDQKLNDSFAPASFEGIGVVTSLGENNYSLQINGEPYPSKSNQYLLADFVGQSILAKGTISSKGNLIIDSIIVQTGKGKDALKVTATGIINEKNGINSLSKTGQPTFIIEGDQSLSQYSDKLVEVKGKLEKNKILLDQIKFK